MRALFALLILGSTAAAEPLGLADHGIFPDLDAQVRQPPPGVHPERTRTVIDPRHGLLVLWEDDRPVKAYPFPLRPDDAAELAPIIAGRPQRVLGAREPVPGGDRDDDGIPDALDLLLGAKKVALNGAAYGGDYISIPYPGGDVPRAMGVCTDVIVRALRNAGVDLQRELHEDIARAPRAYPMVKRADANIDQRRVRTILPWFQRHLEAHGTDPRSASDPFLPGDILFMDTFPSRPGPEHVGIVSDRTGPSGLPLVINNWTEGYHEAEMDLLETVAVTNRFRLSGTPARP
jgi:uncharacterized protein YijF (DUF1287 family)